MITFKKMREACWSGFKQVGMKKKGQKLVPNCVPEEDQKPFDNYFGVNLYNVINEDTKKQIIVSEDNIERIRL